MSFNTGNAVPSSSSLDLSDNAENFDSAVNLQTDTWSDRLAVTRDTVNGRIKKMGYAVPIAYAGGELFTVNDNVKTVVENSIVYAPLTDALPFTTSGTFVGDDDAKFFVVQGITNDQIINDLSQEIIYPTITAFKSSLDDLPDNKSVRLLDRKANYTKVTGVVGADDIDIIGNTALTQSLVLITNLEIDLDTMGLQTAIDIKPLIDKAISRLPLGGKITAKIPTIEASDTIEINTPFIKLEFLSTNVNPVAAFPSTNVFNVTAANVKLKNISSDINSQLVTLVNASALATKLKVFNTITVNAGGQVIKSLADETMVSGVDATNCAIDAFTTANGVVSLEGKKSKAFDINLTDCFGKGIAFRGDKFSLKGFDINNTLNQVAAGGIGVYVGFEVKKGSICNGEINTCQTHCMKVSGGSEKISVSSVDYINNGTVLAASPNAMLEISGVKDSNFTKLNFNYTNGAAVLDAMARIVFHTGPNYPSVNNTIGKSTFRSSDPLDVPRAINIVGGVGLNSSDNTIDGCPLIEGVVTIGGTVGDTGNTIQGSKIVCESFAALTSSNSTNTKIINNEIINTRERVGSGDYLIRSDSSTGLTVKGNILKGASTGIRSTDPDVNISDNDFRMVKDADSIADVHNIQMSGGALGIYTNNNLREATVDIGAGLLTSVNNNVTSAA